MLISFLVILSMINSAIELEISAPSFPFIMEYFATTENEVGLTITYNFTGFCIASLFYGPLSERYGRRIIMLIGNGILAFGAIGCVIAPSMNFLLVSRFIQGLGAATSAVVTTALMSDLYSPKKAARLYGIMNTIFSIIIALSPIMGGFLTYYIGWRGNYGFVASISIIAWICLYLLLPETLEPKHRKKSFNIKGMIKDYKKLLSSPIFLASSAAPSILYSAYMSLVALGPFVYMEAFGLPLITYTFYQAIIVVAFTLSSLIGSKMVNKVGEIRMIKFGKTIYILSGILMISAKGPIALTLCACLSSAGFAIIYPIIFAHSVEVFPEIRGTASSALMSMRYLICSIGTGVAIYIYKGNVLEIALFMVGIGVCSYLLLYYIIKNMEFECEKK